MDPRTSDLEVKSEIVNSEFMVKDVMLSGHLHTRLSSVLNAISTTP
jgi:hypothetical protein